MFGKPSRRQRGPSPTWYALSRQTAGTVLDWGSGTCGPWSGTPREHLSQSRRTLVSLLTPKQRRPQRPTTWRWPGSTLRAWVAAGKALGENPAEIIDAFAERVPALAETAGNPLINTAAGGMLLENYLATRSFELVVHSLDIAAAVPDIEGPEFSDQLLSQVARVAATAAVLFGRGAEMRLALTGRATLRPGFSVV